jgi:putative Mg2+ transporter-C (MgtC) family protein
MEEKALRALVSEHGFSIANLSYRFDRGDRGDGYFEYRMSIRTINMANWPRLAESLQKNRDVHEFRLSPTGD